MSHFDGFPPETFQFLKQLSENNNREWFAENKDRYEAFFLAPAMGFIEAMQKPLEKTAPMLVAQPKKVGGSLMRIYKDTRFSKDKTPYKTNIGIHFRHSLGKDVHAPGYYLHLALDECFVGAGMWRPDSPSIKSIREHIVANPTEWKRIRNGKKFCETFDFYEDRLKSAPRGFDKEHPLIDDLRLKSFIGMRSLTRKELKSKDLVKQMTTTLKTAAPLMRFLCESLGQPY